MISVTITGPDGPRALRLLAEDDERIAAQTPAVMSPEEIEAAILTVLVRPMERQEIYTAARLPHPWIRAGHVLRRLRERGAVRSDRGTYFPVRGAR